MKTPSHRPTLKRWLVGLLLLSGVIIAVLNRSEIEEFAELARKAQPAWLCAAAVQQAREMGVRISFRDFARLGVPVTLAALAGLIGWAALMN